MLAITVLHTCTHFYQCLFLEIGKWRRKMGRGKLRDGSWGKALFRLFRNEL